MSEKAPFRYRAEVLERLWRHGVQPTVRTPPELVRGFVRDLYKYEIRLLRDRMLRNEFPKETYAARVEELRRQYPVLALPARLWLEP
ncbi:MAG: hypothetical protein C5B57_03775 [Blastocatellia bacterium]|nr:MAG: hypothetical protein C5B57_03775 [Blastocatellia bacterium]